MVLTETFTTQRTIVLDETVGGAGVITVVIQETAEAITSVSLTVDPTVGAPVTLAITPEGWTKFEQALRRS